ncbi:MAG: acetylornithine deacetylase [Hyphomicrobiales bacterium]|nr:acetylornithine deacetylase [Hyphomicrobiales bacterium]MCP5370750.1 acetylornithine deacetylase [Hyphomicrobiales bacterium]
MTPVEMIAKLCSFDTVSAKSNLELIHYVRDYLAGFGVESHLVANGDGSKANLYATIGPMAEGGVVLSGHTDVVPVEGQDWHTDPFAVVERDGRLYGRGTADMKSFPAIALALVPEMVARGLKRPVHLALSYDEEIGCLGAPSMIAEMAANLPKAEAVFVGEPTEMRIVTAKKGMAAYETRVTGHEAHSSQPHRGTSAVMAAARLIAFLDRMMRENRDRADPASPFEPPYTTLTSGLVRGGTAMNILARECVFHWDLRFIPGENAAMFRDRFDAKAAEILAEMRAIAPECDIQTTAFADAPALKPEPDGAAEQLARKLTGHNATHVVSYAAEAGQFQEGGFSVVMCGPGSIDQAHQPNEFIELSQVEAGVAFMRRLIDHLAA